MRSLDELDLAGDILTGHSRHMPAIRVRILPGGEHDEDAGRVGRALWARGGQQYWVVLDGSTPECPDSTYYDEEELEVLDARSE